MDGLPELVCPECGEAFEEWELRFGEEIRPATGRLRHAGIVVICIVLFAVVPLVLWVVGPCVAVWALMMTLLVGMGALRRARLFHD